MLTLRNETVEISGYKMGGATIFLIHDFTSNGQTGWIKVNKFVSLHYFYYFFVLWISQHISVALLRKGKYNIISIDWEGGAEPPFAQAISNARVVALEAIVFINNLKVFVLEKIHIYFSKILNYFRVQLN